MGKQKLNIRFHNPNSMKNSSEYIGKIFIAANVKKLEQKLKENPVQKQQSSSPLLNDSGELGLLSGKDKCLL